MSSNHRSRRLKKLFTIPGGCGGSRQHSATTAPAQPKPRCRKDPQMTIQTTSSSAINSSVAIVKDSDEPYNDFRQSMLQMIFEKEMYSRDELQELLDCFLKMNSVDHHDVIVRAFTEIMSHDGPICVGSRQISKKP